MAAHKLYMNGYTYTRVGKAQCPMPGRERCMIATEHDGNPAYWTDGYIYVREEKLQAPVFHEKVVGWAKKVKGFRP